MVNLDKERKRSNEISKKSKRQTEIVQFLTSKQYDLKQRGDLGELLINNEMM